MRSFFIFISALIIGLIIFTPKITDSQSAADSLRTENRKEKDMERKINKSDSEWRKILSEEQFYVLRENGTERAFTGKYDKFFEDGNYYCAACGNLLFNSKTKYNSGSGWPSFYDFADEGSIITAGDNSFGMERDEISCAKCGGHLGHVFEDGPPPTGLRYCINSISLNFEPKTKE
jgi:peptide-methionine (R)-S-oxide reductase